MANVYEPCFRPLAQAIVLPKLKRGEPSYTQAQMLAIILASTYSDRERRLKHLLPLLKDRNGMGRERLYEEMLVRCSRDVDKAIQGLDKPTPSG